MRAATAIVVLLSALAFTASHAGKYYKWTDAQGTVHGSDRPPQNQAAKTVNVDETAPTLPRP